MKYSHTTSLRIVVAGYIVGGPLGGLVWHHLQYVLGINTYTPVPVLTGIGSL